MGSAVAGALAGICLAAGLAVVAWAIIDPPSRAPSLPVIWQLRGRLRAVRSSGGRGEQRRHRFEALAAPAGGLLVWLLSGWPVAGFVVAAAVWGAPALFGTARLAQRRIARLEALESWTRRLADLRAAGAGLEQALVTSLKTCPEPLRGEVANLASRLGASWRTRAALRAFADELNEPAADLVVAVLLLETERRGAGITRVLDDLAETVADEVRMRRQVEADRAKPRTTAHWVTAITLGVVAVGSFNHTYIRPYGTALGQLVLAGTAVGFAVSLWWMRALALGRPEPRLLTNADHATAPERQEGAVR